MRRAAVVLWLFLFVPLCSMTRTRLFAQDPTPAETTKSDTKAKTETVDLNSATKEQLMTVLGIDETNANKIIANRPYKSTKELKTKRVISDDLYKRIVSKVTIKQG
jgi:competence protein ComEA